jgi:arylsulfatase A-like enzyme/tetratricopeptide (TPR) repeat protein
MIERGKAWHMHRETDTKRKLSAFSVVRHHVQQGLLIMQLLRFGLVSSLLLALACSSPPQFNILLVSIDTCRPDHLGCYGYRDSVTPNLDALASEGIVFENARSCVPLTLPSHVSMMTGLFPSRHGVHDNGAYVAAESLTTLAEKLQAHGYRTSAFIGAFPLESRFNLDQGFDYYGDYFDGPAHMGGPTAGTIASMSSERPADAVTAEFLAWFPRFGAEPFFSWIHYFDPHQPYEPPASYALRYPGHEYDAEIAFVDSCLGAVIAYLDNANLLERTIIVVTADHGEGLGDHGEDDHGLLVYDSTLRVPLIIRAPKELDFRGSVSLPIETVDIMPTILQLAGMEVEHAVDGISLVSVMRGESVGPRISYFESFMGRLHFGWSGLAGVTCGSWKYIHGSKPELYDIAKDPAETDNVFHAFPEVAALLREELFTFTSTWAPHTGTPPSAISAETRARLHSLGYTTTGKYLDSPYEFFSGPSPQDQMPLFHLLTIARRHAYREEWAAAAAAYRHSLEGFPSNRDALMGLTLALVMTGDSDAALHAARHAVAVHPDQGDTWLALAMLHLGHGHPVEAQAAAEMGLTVGAEPISAWLLIGQCAEANGDIDNAERAYRHAVAHDPCNIHAAMSLARILARTGARSDLERTLKQTAERHPLLPMAHYDYGTVLLRRNETKAAQRCFEHAIELCPAYANAHYALALLLHRQGNDSEALRHLRVTIRSGENALQVAEARSLADQITHQ